MAQYNTILVDPPWHYDSWPGQVGGVLPGSRIKSADIDHKRRKPLDYNSMSVAEICALPVLSLANPRGCHLYLWTTNRYLPDAFTVAKAWGFRYSQLLVWAKTPMGLGPGGTFAQNAEFILFCRRGKLKHRRRIDSVWHNWKRTAKHSRKPEACQEMIEQVSPGPYVELFARRHREGWDCWGDQIESTIAFKAYASIGGGA